MAECGGNVAAAARMLKISRAQIDYRLKRMSPSRAGPAPAAPPG
jgi:transcriptional regulator with GAF, ATPase, and Fis domain